MDYAQDDELRAALTSATPPPLALYEYPPAPSSAPQDGVPAAGKAMTWATRSAGRAARGAKNTFEIFGGGRDIFDGADEFHFVSRKANDHF